jgi:hypothetical protein
MHSKTVGYVVLFGIYRIEWSFNFIRLDISNLFEYVPLSEKDAILVLSYSEFFDACNNSNELVNSRG